MTSATLLSRADRARPLGQLVGSVDSFLEDTFEREPWLRPTGATGLPTFTLTDVDELLHSALLGRPFFRLVRDGSTVPTATYTRTVELSGGSAAGVCEPARVRQLLGEGATMVLESAHRFVPSLARWCANLALDLELATQANVYVTPPGGTGFAAHVDTHDVFVLQMQGTKQWTVRQRSRTLPHPVRADRAELTAPTTVDTPVLTQWHLEPGAVAYLPRGFPHSAAAGNDDFSVHITVGVLAPTINEVVQAMVARTGARRWTAQTVKALSLTAPPEDLAAVDLDVADYRAVTARRIVRSLATPTSTGLASLADKIDRSGDSNLTLGVDAVVLEPGVAGGLTAVLPDREIEFSAATAATARQLLTEAASAGGVAVGRLDDDATTLAIALVESGLLVVHG